MHDPSLRKTAEKLRRQGHSLNEIKEKLSISKSTASLWCRNTPITQKGQTRLQTRKAQTARPSGGHIHAQRRKEAFEAGAASTLSCLDALCVGLYWGDGNKWKRMWKFTNSDFDTVRLMVGWGVRSGQKRGQFRAVVIVHDGDITTNQEVRDHWSKAGIPKNRISVTRVSKPSKNKHQGRLPFGTCQLSPIKNSAWLYSYWEGQLKQIQAR